MTMPTSLGARSRQFNSRNVIISSWPTSAQLAAAHLHSVCSGANLDTNPEAQRTTSPTVSCRGPTP